MTHRLKLSPDGYVYERGRHFSDDPELPAWTLQVDNGTWIERPNLTDTDVADWPDLAPVTAPLPTLPVTVRLPDYGGLPRFAKLDDTDTWHVVGPDSTVRPGCLVTVELANGTRQQVQVDELVAERTTTHRAGRVRYVAATVARVHDREFCRPCSGKGVELDGTLCLCECHGRTLVDHVFDGGDVSPHTFEGRIVLALRDLAGIPHGPTADQLAAAVNQVAHVLTGPDYHEYAHRFEAQRKGATS